MRVVNGAASNFTKRQSKPSAAKPAADTTLAVGVSNARHARRRSMPCTKARCRQNPEGREEPPPRVVAPTSTFRDWDDSVKHTWLESYGGRCGVNQVQQLSRGAGDLGPGPHTRLVHARACVAPIAHYILIRQAWPTTVSTRSTPMMLEFTRKPPNTLLSHRLRFLL